MKFPYLRWLVLTFPLLLAAEPAVKLPEKVQGSPGSFIRVKADTDGKQVRWLALDDGLNVFPVELLKDTKTLVVVAPVAGQYRVVAWTASGDVPSEAAVCVVVVGDGPTPPPPPSPPAPSDPLARAVREAYAAEADAGKATQLKALADFYRDTAVRKSRDSSLANYGQLFAALQRDRRAVVPDAQLVKVRNAVGDYLNTELGAKADVLVDRVKAPATFARIADALGAVK